MEVEGRAEGGLGAVALARGDLDSALEHYRRSVELLEAAGDSFQSLRMKRMLEGVERDIARGHGDEGKGG